MRNLLNLMLITLLVPVTAAPVLAQEASGALEEIVVTAQRREQNLQNVPISITAFSGAALEKSNIRSASEYLMQTPNVSYTEDGQTGARGIGLSIRGIGGMVSGENAFINTVGIYIDEFSVVSVPNQVANPQLPDMERVEVLRGPQGTYFGRNAVGGALNLVTKRPTDEFGGEVRAGYENYQGANDAWVVTGILNVPVSDTFRVRGVLSYEDSGGLVDNICATGASASSCPIAAENNFTPNGSQNSGHESTFFRLSADLDISDQTTVKTTFFYTKEEQGHDENVPSGVMDLDSTDTFGTGVAQDPGTGFWPNNQNKLSHDLSEFNNNESKVAILNISHALNDTMALKWVTGIIDADFDRFFDQDLVGGMDALKRTNSYQGKSRSTEVRFEITEDRYDFVAGLMYAKDHQEQDNNVAVSTNATATANGVGVLPPFPLNLGLARNHKEFDVESKAIFADYTFHASEKLDLTVGARYTDDKVENSVLAFGIRPTCCFPGSPGFPGGPGFAFFQSFANSPRPVAEGSSSFSDVTPRFVANYRVTDDVSVYGTISKGYKAGGNSVGNNTNQPGSPAFTVPFNEETLWNYELGFKSELMDHRLRLNGAVFHLQWDDLQMESFRFLTPGDLSSNFEQTINIENAEATGAEIEILAAVTDNFTLSGGLGVLDTEMTSDTVAQLTGGFFVNLQGLDLPKAPELTASLAGEYRWTLADNEAWLRLEYAYRDSQYSDIEGLTNLQTRGPSPNSGVVREMPFGEFPYKAPAFDVFNLRAGYLMGSWSFNAYVQNLLEEEYYTGTQENFGLSGIRLRPHPRVIGGNISFKF
ncbi:MAG: TonB-dependent receptor [Xanthomonadales bacterium]|nr:TonB-dependent receptor [Xanthomonadales bacterium]